MKRTFSDVSVTGGIRAGLAAAGLVIAMGFSAPLLAQGYPNKLVRIVVPFPAGSVTETFTRLIGENMEATLGQKVLTEARAGAGTEIGTKYVIGQPGDGYTLLLATPSLAIKSAQSKPPFDGRKDLLPVGQFNNSPLFVFVNASLPVKTGKELVDYARANPGKLNMVNYGVGTLGHLMGELLVYKAGAKVVSVPFNGAVNAAVALAQGNGDFGFNVMSPMKALIQQGKVRVLATSTVDRDPTEPDVPSMTEAGVPNFNVASWSGFMVPAGTPRDVIQKLNAAVGASIKTPAVRTHFQRVGIGLSGDISTPEQFGAVINTTVDDFAKLIRDAKIEFD